MSEGKKIEDRATQAWLNSQKGTNAKSSTKGTYRTWWSKFLEFTGLNGDQILESRKTDKDFAWEAKVLDFKKWLIEEKKLSAFTATAASMAVRGFFAFHRVPLQFRRVERTKLAERVRKTEDYRFSLEDLKKLYDVADLQERYILTSGKSFGLRAGDFLRLTRGDLEGYISRDAPISIGEITTEKENVKAYPFIDCDAKPIIELMLSKMNREGRKEPAERMLDYSGTIMLSRVLERLVKRAGLNTGSKNVRFHCLRKFLVDRLSSFMSESKWKQIVGKKITEGAYVSPDSLREDYARATAEISFTSRTSLEVTAKEAARAEFEKLLIPEQRAILAKGGLQVRQRTKKTVKSESDCSDGKGCQRIIQEPELEKALTEGWKFISALPSGKILISNET